MIKASFDMFTQCLGKFKYTIYYCYHSSKNIENVEVFSQSSTNIIASNNIPANDLFIYECLKEHDYNKYAFVQELIFSLCRDGTSRSSR